MLIGIFWPSQTYRMPIEIRKIAAQHAEGFRRAVDIVARERKYLAFLEAPPIDEVRQFVIDNIERGHPQYVALQGGEVVGWCDVVPKTGPAHVHCGVLGMGLLPTFRGLGTALITATLQEASRYGIIRFELTVHADNIHAIKLYEKVGFETEGRLRDAVLIDRLYKDLILMAKIDRARSSEFGSSHAS
jgi:RimJ/RimL family protein N-acetyltransferase